MADTPIACTLTPDALQARRDGLLADLLRHATHRELTDSVDAERQCCRFLRFVITVEPDGGPLVLELSGPAGTREFIAGLLDR